MKRLNSYRMRLMFIIVATIILLCDPVWGQQIEQLFYDDFSDGDAQDGSPISWLWNAATADVAVVNGDLTVRPKVKKPSVPFPMVTAKDGQKYAGDLVVTAQFTMTQPGDASAGIFLRSSLPEDRQCYVGGIYATNQLFLERDDGVSFNNKVVFGKYWIPGFNIGSEDLILQLSVSDFLTPQGTRSSRIELRAWRPGEEIPIQPQISVIDSKYADGLAGFYVDSGAYAPGLSDITVRWIEFVGECPEPIVDFNGDGIVDCIDMCMMVDYWGTNESLYDIAPPPLGDGIVDVQDLILLSEHLFEEIFPSELVAYWKMDEPEGDIAYNSIGDNHGILSGNPTWRTDSGQVDGSLDFDGIDDYVETGFVLNPTGGAFSVFAWIRGGAPGQVIISQTDGEGTGETWLGADASGGNLMTGLRPAGGRSPTPPMVSDFVITDGQWHHVGIVVMEQKVRHLYVDGVRVAADTRSVELPSSNGGLYIGAGKTLDAGTFFSGLIDEVRIYNRAVSP
jgi:hypothetical protein